MQLLRFALLLAVLRTTAYGAAFSVDVQDIAAAEALPPSTSLLGRYADSGLDFDSWTARMVDAGHLSHPVVKPHELGIAMHVRDGNGQGWTARIKNAACVKVHGQRDTIKRAEAHFCGWVEAAEQIWVQSKEEELMRTLCANGEICRLALKSTVDFTNPMKDHDDVGAMCHQLFDALIRACPDGGGVADAEIKSGSGARLTGHIEAAYSPNHGETCQSSTSHRCITHEEL